MLDHFLAAALGLWREAEGGEARLINLSENHTFRIDAPAGAFALRLHRRGYQSAAGIRSELDWLAALHQDADLAIVRPIPARDGELLQQVLPGCFAVLFAFESGSEPVAASPALFATLGAFAARLHLHVLDWQRPSGFTRPHWTAETILAPSGNWGDWRVAPGVAPVRATLDAIDAYLRDTLAAYGQGRDRFGLIHADMRLANLLVDGPRTILLDFDDSGFSWFTYDLAAALSFLETTPEVPVLRAAWLAAYTAIRPLSEEHLASIDVMILLRRMALLAWIGSHGETDLARAQAPRFAADTARLGQAVLDQR